MSEEPITLKITDRIIVNRSNRNLSPEELVLVKDALAKRAEKHWQEVFYRACGAMNHDLQISTWPYSVSRKHAMSRFAGLKMTSI